MESATDASAPFIANLRIEMELRTLALLVLSTWAGQCSAQAGAVFEATGVKSHSLHGRLTNYACRPETALPGASGDGVVLHSERHTNPNLLDAHVVLPGGQSGRAVTSCAAFEFNEVNPTSVSVTYKTTQTSVAACSDGGSNTGTWGVDADSGKLEVFVSPDKGPNTIDSWTWIEALPRQTSIGTSTLQIPAQTGTVRSVLVCRNGTRHTREDIEVKRVQLTSSAATAMSSPPSAMPTLLKRLYEYWDGSLASVKSQCPNCTPSQQVYGYSSSSDPAFKYTYQVPAVYSLLSGWMVEQNPEWRQAIEQQADNSYFNRRFQNVPRNIFLGPEILRDSMAREAIAQYHLYEIFRDEKYLRRVEEMADVIKNLTRTHPGVNGKTLMGADIRSDMLLMHTSYSYSNGNFTPVIANLISPNQNAEVGLLFTLLYHTQDSTNNAKYYQNPIAMKIAKDELDAAIIVQKKGTSAADSPNGALPLDNYSPADNHYDDTNYASYAFSLIAMANALWQEPRYTNALAAGGSWLSGYMQPSLYSWRWLDNAACVNCQSGTEMWQRLIPIRSAGTTPTLSNDYVTKMYTEWLNEHQYDGRHVFFALAGVPVSYHRPDSAPIKLSVTPTRIPVGGQIAIKWSSSDMQSCNIRIKIPSVGVDEIWDYTKNGTGTNSGLPGNTDLVFTCNDKYSFQQQVTAKVVVN